MKLGIIFGGRSSEHEISCLSAASIIRALENSKYELVFIGITKSGDWRIFDGTADEIENGSWQASATAIDLGRLKEYVDFAFPILHGRFGEDGTIQGLFEMLDLPYAGCNVLGSALAMDKAAAKELFARVGLPVCDYVFVDSSEFVICEDFKGKHFEIDENKMEEKVRYLEEKLSYPMFVKPVNMGSSVGITKAKNRDGLQRALKFASEYDHRILVEKAVDAREIEIGIIGNHELLLSALGEILPSAEFYDYEAKYLDGGKSRLCIPAMIEENIKKKIEDMAKIAYKVLDCSGLARLDFFLERSTGKVYINEINTMPGFTKFSMFPLLFAEAGIKYSDLLERIIELGYEKYYTKNNS
ncbi:MAG: D-alanine--D-alanine ligase family protein [Eubacteriales bacterium]